MTTIKQHTQNTNYFVVRDPSAKMVARAKELACGNWAKIQSNGWIIVHKGYVNDFRRILERNDRKSAIAPEFDDIDEFHTWVSEHINSAEIANDFMMYWRMKDFNRVFAGQTVEEIEDAFYKGIETK